MTSIGEAISRVRNLAKGTSQDAFLTDRFIYSLLVKYAKMYIKRQDPLNVRLKFASLFRRLTDVPLKEVNLVEANCASVSSKCTMMRTVDKIPVPYEGAYGAFIRTVSSIDGGTEVYRTQPAAYTSMTQTSGFKYNNKKYYWYLNGYLYFPNLEWPAIAVEGIWEDDVSLFTCEENSICKIRQDEPFNIPDDLFAEIEKQVLTDLGFTMQVPSDPAVSDKQNIVR